VKSLQEAIRLQYNEETSPSQSRSLNHTAQELHTAANSAERSIRYSNKILNQSLTLALVTKQQRIPCRDLLAGVDHLRVVAAALQSMERIEEVRTKRDRDK
jgi:DNA helicase TIP49 (TBP-interacting protein)